METVKTFIGITICFALAFVVITAWPLIQRVGNGIEAGVHELDFGIELAGHKRAWERSGLNDNLVDPKDTSFEREAAGYRKANARVSAHQKVGACEDFTEGRYCTSRSYAPGCEYDGAISLYWCPRH